MPYISFDLDALSQVPDVARSAGIADSEAAYGLLRMWTYCFKRKVDHVDEAHLQGFFGGDKERVIHSLSCFGFLEKTDASYRVKGAKRYLRIAAAQSERGKRRAAGQRDERGWFVAGQTPAGVQPESSRQPDLTPNTEHLTTTNVVDAARPKKPREPSRQQKFAAWFEQRRRTVLGPSWVEDLNIGAARLNRELKWVRTEPAEQVADAALVYLGDGWRQSQSPPCSLLWFSRDRAQYLSRAKQAHAQGDA